MGGGADEKKHGKILEHDGTVLYLSCGSNYTAICFVKYMKLNTKMSEFYCM